MKAMLTKKRGRKCRMSEDDYLTNWIKITNERGHASGSAHNDNVLPGSKSIVELSKVRDWADSYTQNTGYKVANIRLGDDPPDALCKVNGVVKTLECMGFVNGDLKGRLKDANKKNPGKRFTSSAGDGFHQAQWDEQSFLTKLKHDIEKKVKRYSGRPKFDYLLIYTSENWLFADEVRIWLNAAEISCDGVIPPDLRGMRK